MRIPLLGGVAILAATSTMASTQSSRSSGAVETFDAVIEVERILLEEDMVRQKQLSQQRTLTLNRLGEVYLTLDAAIQRRDSATVETLLIQVESIERQRAEQVALERLLVERVRDRLRRIAVLEAQRAGLEGAEEDSGPLQGKWKVSL